MVGICGDMSIDLCAATIFGFGLDILSLIETIVVIVALIGFRCSFDKIAYVVEVLVDALVCSAPDTCVLKDLDLAEPSTLKL